MSDARVLTAGDPFEKRRPTSIWGFPYPHADRSHTPGRPAGHERCPANVLARRAGAPEATVSPMTTSVRGGDVTVRAARVDDVDAVLALWAVARSASANTPDDAEGVRRLVEHDAGALLLAECEGVVVGTLVAGWDGWRGDMYRLAVLPEHRRHGVARRLVEAGHARLRAFGAIRVTALVGRDEPVARALWSALGYAHDERHQRFVIDL